MIRSYLRNYEGFLKVLNELQNGPNPMTLVSGRFCCVWINFWNILRQNYPRHKLQMIIPLLEWSKLVGNHWTSILSSLNILLFMHWLWWWNLGTSGSSLSRSGSPSASCLPAPRWRPFGYSIIYPPTQLFHLKMCTMWIQTKILYIRMSLIYGWI